MREAIRPDGEPPHGWASDLADSVAVVLAGHPDEVRVETIRAVGDCVEVVYRQPPEGDRRGLRLSETEAKAFREDALGSIAELAFLLAYAGVLESRSSSEFDQPDSDGVRWLRPSEWILP